MVIWCWIIESPLLLRKVWGACICIEIWFTCICIKLHKSPLLELRLRINFHHFVRTLSSWVFLCFFSSFFHFWYFWWHVQILFLTCLPWVEIITWLVYPLICQSWRKHGTGTRGWHFLSWLHLFHCWKDYSTWVTSDANRYWCSVRLSLFTADGLC